jgi:uncharacterized membrane protein
MEKSVNILNRIDGLMRQTKAFHNELLTLKKDVNDAIQIRKAKDPLTESKKPVQPTIVQPVEKVVPPPFPKKPKIPEPEQQEELDLVAQKLKQAAMENKKQTPPVAAKAPPKPKEKKPFRERFPELELILGGNLITFVGIVLLVTGIGFFVSYAIEHNWIGETGRTGIGILAGSALIATAHYLRKNYKVFSSILLGGGIASLYYTIGYAYHVYGLFPQVTAFTLMVIITGFSVFCSVVYDRKEIAILGLIGGFITPFALSNGSGNFVALFTYLLILDVGMAVLAYFKDWKVLHRMSFIFTTLIYGSWLLLFNGAVLHPVGAMVFGSAFFVTFFVMSIVYNIKLSIRFKAMEYFMILTNSFAFYMAGLFVMEEVNGGMYSGLFTAITAVFHFTFTLALYKNKKLDTNVLYILIGLVLTFLTLTGPIQLDGNHITMFWSAEIVLLLWLGQKSGLKLIKTGSFIVTACMVISLLIQWSTQFDVIFAHFYLSKGLPEMNLIFNKGFITNFVAIAAVMLTGHLLKREDKDEHLVLFGAPLFKWSTYRKFFPYVIVGVTYIGLYLEVKYQAWSRTNILQFSMLIIGVFNMLFALGLHIYGRISNSKGFQITALFANVGATILYMVYWHQSALYLRDATILNDIPSAYFGFHYLCTALIPVLLFMLYKQLNKHDWLAGFKKPFTWYATGVMLFVACSELDHIMVMNFADSVGSIASVALSSQKAGYPVVWGVMAFLLISIGMRRKNLEMRLAGMVLLFITLFKIFLIDVWGMTQLGRIISFVSLGVLILVISFMYHRLKRLIFEDNAETENSEQSTANS